MVKVLFICHGNICRSPMAEFILKDMVSGRDIAEQFEIASVATSTEEIWGSRGNPVYPPARKELAKHGINCEGKYATLLQKSDYDKYDYLICMDSANVRNTMRIVGGDPEEKIYKLLWFAENSSEFEITYTGIEGRTDCKDISDPWYSGDFAGVYNEIVNGCEGLLAFLKHIKKQGRNKF